MGKNRPFRRASNPCYRLVYKAQARDGGEGGNRTRDRAFAEPGLTTWRPRHRRDFPSRKGRTVNKGDFANPVNAAARISRALPWLETAGRSRCRGGIACTGDRAGHGFRTPGGWERMIPALTFSGPVVISRPFAILRARNPSEFPVQRAGKPRDSRNTAGGDVRLLPFGTDETDLPTFQAHPQEPARLPGPHGHQGRARHPPPPPSKRAQAPHSQGRRNPLQAPHGPSRAVIRGARGMVFPAAPG